MDLRLWTALLLVCVSVGVLAATKPFVLTATPENEAGILRAIELYDQARRAVARGEQQLAVYLYEDAIEAYALMASAYNNLGMLVFDMVGDRDVVLALLEKGAEAAAQLGDNGTLAATRSNMGFVTRHGREYSVGACLQAIELYDQALAADPEFLDALYNKASALKAIRQLNQAETLLRRVVELDSNHLNAHMDLSSIFYELGEVERAASHLDTIIESPQGGKIKSGAIHNKGHFLKSAGRYAEALEAHEAGVRLAPDSPMALTDLVTSKRTLCLWDGREELLNRMLAAVDEELLQSNGSSSSLLPYDSTLIDVPDAFRKRLAIAHSIAYEQSATLELLPHRSVRAPYENSSRPLRVGYATYDFRDHPMGHLTLGLLEAHDSAKVETYCYSYGVNDDSEWRKRAEKRCNAFRDGLTRSDLAFAQQIGLDAVDIVVDLMAHTTGARLGITALRPSPIIVSYLGYPGTMGSTFTDFVIADRFVVPPEVARASMTEQVVYLPHAYQVNQYDLEIPACGADDHECVRAIRRTQSLPEDAVVLCNFNTIDKMEPQAFSVWMNVLRRSPSAVLWLLEPSKPLSERIQTTLREEAQAHGVHPARIKFAAREPKRSHIARLSAADLFVDSFIYTAHSTAADALWANVPIVSRWGDAFPSRVAASLIRNLVGRPELVSHSSKEFEDLVVHLVQSPALLRRMRKEIARQALLAPLFDTKRITSHIEEAYEALHDLHYHFKPIDSAKSCRAQLVIAPSTTDHIGLAENTGSMMKGMVARGISNQESGNLINAKAAYERVLRAQPNHADAMHLLGLTWYQMGEVEKAAEHLSRVVELYNATSLFRYNRAVVMAKLNRSADAESDLVAALALDPSYTDAFLKLTDMLHDASDFANVVATYKQFGGTALASRSMSKGEQERAYLQYSYSLLQTDRANDAIHLLETVRAEQPKFFRIGYNLAAILSSIKNYSAADEVQIETAEAEAQFIFSDQGQLFVKTQRPQGHQVIAIYCHEYGQSWWDGWGPSSFRSGLGGSEEAVVFMSKELSRLGYWVEVYGNPPQDDIDENGESGVQWYPHFAFNPNDSAIDIFIAWRYHISLAVGAQAKHKIFWVHDVPSEDTKYSRLLREHVDSIFCVSHFQASLFPESLGPKLVVTSNALEPTYFVNISAVPSYIRNQRFVYGSSPNRGLFDVLRAWPRIRAQIPTASLRVFYGFTPAFLDWGRRHIDGFDSWRQKMEIMLRQPGVEYVGLVDHETLAKEYGAAGFYLYPTRFSETSCVSLMKAMANGAIPVTSRYVESALGETTSHFDLGPASIRSETADWLSKWIDSVVHAVMNESETDTLRQKMVKYARTKYRWASVADQWQALFNAMSV